MRTIFLGSGEFGLPTLQAIRQKHTITAVVTQPDRPAGRQRKLTPTPIGEWSQGQGLTVFKTENVNEPAFIEEIKKLNADAAVVIAFGQKLSEPLIAAAGRLTVNLHGSLLPKYRGAAPINWAILNGETEAGVSVISLAQRMDAGLIYAEAATPIDPLETAGELHDRLAALGPSVIERVLDDFTKGSLAGRAQDETHATRAPKLSKADATVNFEATAEHVRRRVHGLTPWPGVHVMWRRAADGVEQPLFLCRIEPEPGVPHMEKLGTVLPGERVAVRDGAVHLLEVQIPGGRVMTTEEFARGHRLGVGDVLRGAS